jgi:hypothetical protein
VPIKGRRGDRLREADGKAVIFMNLPVEGLKSSTETRERPRLSWRLSIHTARSRHFLDGRADDAQSIDARGCSGADSVPQVASLREASADGHPTQRSERGVGLVEVMLALTLLAGSGAVTMHALTTSTKVSYQGSQRVVASELANQALGQIEVLPYADVEEGLSQEELSTSQNPLLSYESGHWVYVPNGEVVPDRNPATSEPPLVPYEENFVKEGVDYQVATYPMVVSGSQPSFMRVVVWVTRGPQSQNGAASQNTGSAQGEPGSFSGRFVAETLLFGPGQVNGSGVVVTQVRQSNVAQALPASPGATLSDCAANQEALLANPGGTPGPGATLTIDYLDETPFSSGVVSINGEVNKQISISVSDVTLDASDVHPVDDCGGSGPNADDPSQPSGSSSGNAPQPAPPKGYEEQLTIVLPSSVSTSDTVGLKVFDSDGQWDSYAWRSGGSK